MSTPGVERIVPFRRDRGTDVGFITVMWFRDLDAVRAFVGDDVPPSHVPESTRAVLLPFDDRPRAYEVLLRETARLEAMPSLALTSSGRRGRQ